MKMEHQNMLGDAHRGKCLIRVLAGANIVLLISLVFYIFHLISIELIKDSTFSHTSAAWWPLWTVTWVITLTSITVQLTLDVMLFRSLPDQQKAIHRCQLWLKVSTGFLVVSVLGFLLSLWSKGRENPYVMLVLGVGGIMARALGIYFVHEYVDNLQSRLPSLIYPVYFIATPPGTLEATARNSQYAPSHHHYHGDSSVDHV